MRNAFWILIGLTLVFNIGARAEKRATRPIQSGDVYRATEAYLQSGQKEEFLRNVLLPVFRAAKVVMEQQLPDAKDLACEMAQALEVLLENPNEELPRIGAEAFFQRPDLVKTAFESVEEKRRPRLIAKIIPAWAKYKKEVESNPRTESGMYHRLVEFDRLMTTWRYQYPQSLSQEWRRD
ncbi:MAG: hypothetical protein V1746_08565 [bacterium]